MTMIRSLLARVYGAVVKRRNKRYDDRRTPIVTVDVPVVSVGNLTVGGTGKTPVVQMLVRWLQQQGYQPGVVLRGYRRRSRGLVVVHNGERLCATVDEAGDEAYLHATALGVPVVVCASKVDAAVHAAGMLPCDVIVVDDGFQHRSLHRDVDIVLVDRATLQGKLLPEGRLREPLTNLRRADVVLLTDATLTAADVQGYTAPEAVIDHVTTTSSSDLTGQRLIVMAGIANPKRLTATLQAGGATVLEEIFFSDHFRYSQRDVAGVITVAVTHAAVVCTTEKDYVKLGPYLHLFEAAGVAVHVVQIEAQVSDRTQQHILDLIAGATDEDCH